MNRGEWVGEIEQFTRNGTKLTIEGRWTLMSDSAGRPKAIFAINTDITAKKLIEAQFLRAQRMESIGTLAGGIAHDLNNVLAPILLSAELLRGEDSPAEREELLALIKTTARRGADMVQQLLSFARGVEGKRAEVQIRYLVQEVLAMVRETFPRGIDVRTSFPDGLWSVNADPTQIHQVLLNLCVNARDAMPRGGILTLSAENVELMESESGPGRFVMIQVEDTGSGIPPEVIDRIFDPFFTTKEVGKGTGLGLSTSLTIVKSHGGFIRVQSEPRHWTRFRVYLPCAARGAAGQTSRPAAALRGRGECVLLVDDEEAMRKTGRRMLELHGYRVLLAEDGADAIATYAARMGEVQVVLMDLNMPVLDGASAIRALRRMNPAVKVIATSGRITEEDGGLEEDGWFLQKPYSVETLLAKLGEVLSAPEAGVKVLR